MSADPFAAAGDSALVSRSSPDARAIAEPLAALAMAFQANAEALRRSHELQADLGRALQRADRSEALVQSTGALNETFRGLTAVQKGLVQRIDSSEKSAKDGRWFLPILVLAAMAVLGAALWLVVKRVGEVEQNVVGTGDIATQLRTARSEGVDEGRREAAAGFDVERKSLTDRADRAADDLRGAIAERDEKAAAAKAAQSDMERLQGEVMTGRNDALRARALEAEVTKLRAEAAVRDPDVERLTRELAEEKATSASLRRRLADVATGRAATTGPAESADSAGMSSDAGSRDTGSRDGGPRDGGPRVDRRDLEQARKILNDLLQESSAGRADYLQVGSIGGVEGDRLLDVVATSYSSAGRVLNFLKARQVRVVTDRVNRRIEMVFDDGSIELNGTSRAFPGGALRKVVAEGDQLSRWSSSGLLFVTTGR